MKRIQIIALLLAVTWTSCTDKTTISTNGTAAQVPTIDTDDPSIKSPQVNLQIPQFSEDGIPNVPAYLQLKNRKWSWKLLDADFDEDDFAAGVEVLVNLAQVGQRDRNYWIINDVRSSPQTVRGMVLEIVRLAVSYKEQKGTLAMELDIQFRLGTEVRAGANIVTGIENDLEERKHLELITALFEDENVRSGFEMTQVWAESTLDDETTPLITRTFLLVNEKDTLITTELAREASGVVNAIADPGMDGLFGGQADWKVLTNEQEFCQAL